MGHKEELLAAARRCLVSRGYARTTARDLVAESGTNLGSIGYHFGSKDALLARALDEVFLEYTEKVLAVAREVGSVGDDPRQAVDRAWAAMTELSLEFRPLLVAFVEALAQPSAATHCGHAWPRAMPRCGAGSSKGFSGSCRTRPKNSALGGFVLHGRGGRVHRAVAARP